jgi:acetone carboxylase gamma subunit
MTLRNIDDLIEMLAAASLRRPMSISRWHGSFRCTHKIYERALAIACPILLPLARHCGITTSDGKVYNAICAAR